MAVTATNEIIDGEMDGDAASSIADHIHALGHVPLRVEEIADGNSRPWWTREVFVFRLADGIPAGSPDLRLGPFDVAGGTAASRSCAPDPSQYGPPTEDKETSIRDPGAGM
jgi:hypothetical protein